MGRDGPGYDAEKMRSPEIQDLIDLNIIRVYVC